MTAILDGAKACETLATRAKNAQKKKEYTDLEKRLKELDKRIKKSHMDDLEHAQQLQPAIDASISLSKKAKKHSQSYIIYNNLTCSLKRVQNKYRITK